MNRELDFRGWTGTEMFYRDDQYLGSFIRRLVERINMNHGSFHGHESYLPNGGNIDEYLIQWTGLKCGETKVYEKAIVRFPYLTDEDDPSEPEVGYISTTTEKWMNGEIRISPTWGVYIYEGGKARKIATKRLLRSEVIGNVMENPELLQEADEAR